MSTPIITDGGPVFPCELLVPTVETVMITDPEASRYGETVGQTKAVPVRFPGISVKAYAAIHLRVPDSGLDWLDAMITRAKRDELAKDMQEDDRLVKCVRAMDDGALVIFAAHPTAERDEHITETGCITDLFSGKPEVEKVAIRLQLEAKCIAKVRYMQADAMLKEGEKAA